MLTFLPIATFAVVFIISLGRSFKADEVVRDWRDAFLEAAIVWGVLVVLFSEGLGLFGMINRTWLGLSWTAALLIGTMVGLRSGALAEGWRRVLGLRPPAAWEERGLLIGLAGIVILLFIIAWISPPNNVDSLIYHMTRVVHWAQNGSLRHYVAAREHELLKPIWAETAILNLRVLWGSDRPANLVQWSSMVGSLIGVGKLAQLLGADGKSQLVASAFAASIPMGILQATSTQNDYVVAFWVVCLFYLVVLRSVRPLSLIEVTRLASVVGLGVLTKGTFFVYFGPPLAWYFLLELRRGKIVRSFAHAVAIAAAVVVLNLGFWARNIATFGGPYGSSNWLQANLWFDISFLEPIGPAAGPPVAQPAEADANLPHTNIMDRALDNVSDLMRRELQMIGRNLTAPVGFVHQWFVRLFEAAPGVFGPNYASSIAGSAWNHEDTAGNPLHLMLVPLSAFMALMLNRDWNWRRSVAYGAVGLATYGLVPVVIGHGASLWSIRYQLPFFVLWSPMIARAALSMRRRSASVIVGSVLLLSSLPWLLLNNMRPIIGIPPWPTAVGSILVVDRAEVLFATNPGLRDDYEDLTEVVAQSECRQLGLRIEGEVLEYPFWWLLMAPESGFSLEVLNVAPSAGQSRDPNFEPCSIICSICGDRLEFAGMPRIAESDSMALFMDQPFFGTIRGSDNLTP